ncbi:hypothetical protein M434DRAFT_382930 [Hypoxylon sp. CO27-5]|nr:hypothetical protein M434DRAFT_382930 [Hypoxylon sp. CO27-5]
MITFVFDEDPLDSLFPVAVDAADAVSVGMSFADGAVVLSAPARGKISWDVIGTARYNVSASPALAQTTSTKAGSSAPYVEYIFREWHCSGPLIEVIKLAPFPNMTALSLQAVAKAHDEDVVAQQAAKLADVVNTSSLEHDTASAMMKPSNGARVIVADGELVILVSDCPTTPYCTSAAASNAAFFKMPIKIKIISGDP